MFEDIYHLGVKALITNTKGNALLLRVNPDETGGNDYWDLPGGRVQEQQTILETLRREVEEEIGVRAITTIGEVGMTLSNIRIPIGEGKTAGLILSVYECKIPEDSVIRLSKEHIEYRWYVPQQASELLSKKYPTSFCDMIANKQSS